MPHEPLNPVAPVAVPRGTHAMATNPRMLEICVRWRGCLIDMKCLRDVVRVTIGSGPGCDLEVPLGCHQQSHVLVRPQKERWVLHRLPSMVTSVRRGNMRSTLAGDGPVSLADGATFEIDFGEITLEIGVVARSLAPAPAPAFDTRGGFTALATTVLFSLFICMLALLPVEHGVDISDLAGVDRVAAVYRDLRIAPGFQKPDPSRAHTRRSRRASSVRQRPHRNSKSDAPVTTTASRRRSNSGAKNRRHALDTFKTVLEETLGRETFAELVVRPDIDIKRLLDDNLGRIGTRPPRDIDALRPRPNTTDIGRAKIAELGRTQIGDVGRIRRETLRPDAIEALLRKPVPAPLRVQTRMFVRGDLDDEVIQRVVRAHIHEIRLCYERTIKTNHHLDGEIWLKWIIASSGYVSYAAVIKSALEDKTVERCIRSKVIRWRFPKPADAEPVVVTYPIFFRGP